MGDERFPATVAEWDDEDGAGVLRLDDGRLAWAHFSEIEAPEGAFRTLQPGADVTTSVTPVSHGPRLPWQAERIAPRG